MAVVASPCAHARLCFVLHGACVSIFVVPLSPPSLQPPSAGGGLWATTDLLLSEGIPFYGQGEFAMMSSAGLLEAVQFDGIPRYIVSSADVLGTLFADGEVDPSNSMSLVLELHPACFLYYMNACENSDDVNQNVTRKSVFIEMKPTKDTAAELLVDADKGVAFQFTRDIKKGEQLLHHFPTRQNLSGKEVASPSRKSARLSSRRDHQQVVE